MKSIDELTRFFIRMKKSEWIKIRNVVDKLYDSEAEQVELSDPETVQGAMSYVHDDDLKRTRKLISSAIRDTLAEYAQQLEQGKEKNNVCKEVERSTRPCAYDAGSVSR